MSHIYVIHENSAWAEPLCRAFQDLDLPFEEWFLDRGRLDLTVPPPEGVFYNRMSASSHTRGHRYAPEYTGAVLACLEAHDRCVINSGRALQLEISKVAQYAALSAYGIVTPRTVAAVGRDAILEAGREFEYPFITKHNRAGKGLGVHLFRGLAEFERYVEGPTFEAPVDGITLIQEYIEAPEPFITRVEFVGGRLLYAVRVDTSEGFELCPADACRVDGLAPLFHIVPDFVHPLVERYERFLEGNGIQIAGVEFILDRYGNAYTYDINTNTNYNAEAEAAAGLSGMRAIATYLGEELARMEGARRKTA